MHLPRLLCNTVGDQMGRGLAVERRLDNVHSSGYLMTIRPLCCISILLNLLQTFIEHLMLLNSSANVAFMIDVFYIMFITFTASFSANIFRVSN